jgi:fucose 4-O-acetylase-like acetyltransferase
MAPPARDAWPDALRAAAIYGVVVIHLSGPDPVVQLFRFCVPVFVGVWAAYFEQGLARRAPAERPAYVRSRLGRLAVAYVFWSAVSLARYAPEGWPADAILRDFATGSMWAGQYFLVALLQLTALFPLVRPALGRWVVAVGWSVGAVAGPLLGRFVRQLPAVAQFGDQPFWYWLPFVAVGVAWARGEFPRVPAALALALGVAALALAPAEFALLQTAPTAAPLVSASVGSVALLIAASRARVTVPGRVGRVLGYVGQNTFAVFVTNPLVIGVLLRTPAAAWLDSLPARLVVAVGVVAAGLALGWVFRRARLGVLVGG